MVTCHQCFSSDVAMVCMAWSVGMPSGWISPRFSLLTMPVDEYPSLPQMPDVAGTVAGDVFTAAVAQVTTAASRDETLPILTGVRMEIEGDRVTLLSTDRYRLAMRELSWRPATPGTSAVALVRARTLSEVAKALGGAGETVTDPKQIGPALDRAYASGVPYLVNVITDVEAAYPRSTFGI